MSVERIPARLTAMAGTHGIEVKTVGAGMFEADVHECAAKWKEAELRQLQPDSPAYKAKLAVIRKIGEICMDIQTQTDTLR